MYVRPNVVYIYIIHINLHKGVHSLTTTIQQQRFSEGVHSLRLRFSSPVGAPLGNKEIIPVDSFSRPALRLLAQFGTTGF